MCEVEAKVKAEVEAKVKAKSVGHPCTVPAQRAGQGDNPLRLGLRQRMG